jgi:diguanylate cyclase
MERVSEDALKQWVQKLIEQLDYDWNSNGGDAKKSKSGAKSKLKISEDRATLLYVIDAYSKHLVDVENYPVRKVRESFDAFAKELVAPEKENEEDALFRFRQYFMTYKTAEYAYLRKTFEDFKGIVWSFVEQMSEDARQEQQADNELNATLKDLKDAVEADSIPLLRAKSRQFIESYQIHQSKKEERRSKRVRGIKKNLDVVKKQLSEADHAARVDHLTGAWNRKSFEEQMKEHINMFQISKTPVSLLTLDIDFFKKINDNYGHDIGDFVLKECVKLLQKVFSREGDFVARVGGEEFAILLPNHAIEHAIIRAEDAMTKIRKEVFVEKNMELRFTVSMGIAQLMENETSDHWVKRADQALYESKHGGRNRYTVSRPGSLTQVA